MANEQTIHNDEGVGSDSPEQLAVRAWQRRILAAKSHRKKDFARMVDDMDFVAGYQHKGQSSLDSDEYTANLTMRAINQKVATLYARDPKCVSRQRKRRLYRLWDGKLESLALAVQNAMLGDVESMALIEDYQQGQNFKELLDAIGDTLEILYQWNVDRQEPEFKLQLKQLVRRTCVTGVAFARLSFQRTYEEPFSEAVESSSFEQMKRRAGEIADRISSGDLDVSSAETASLSMLFNSLQVAPQEMEERLVFDFPPVTSVIIDPRCRILKGFVGAMWIAQEYVIPLAEARAFFGVPLHADGKLALFDEIGQQSDTIVNATTFSLGEVENALNPADAHMRVRIWEVFDKYSCNRFFIADGWPTFLVPPEPIYPKLSRFWYHFPLTFNDVETEDDTNATIYPPSDVQLVKHVQKEWNRSREELRNHRKANRPRYLAAKGILDEEDRAKLECHQSSAVIELKVGPDVDLSKVIVPFSPAPIDPALYDTQPLIQDMLLAIGLQEANLGPVSKGDTTATESTISEQSRMSTVGSNVDDLDDFLTDLARAGGELLLSETSPQTVLEVVGPGAIWPSADRDMFKSEVWLVVEAASSGRPNKAIEVANYERLAPLLLSAGANPHFLVREGVKRLDDRLDLNEAFPLNVPMAAPSTAKNGSGEPQQKTSRSSSRPEGSGGTQNPVQGAQQPLQDMPSQAPVPLPGA